MCRVGVCLQSTSSHRPTPASASLRPTLPTKGGGIRKGAFTSPRRHLGADFGAQLVYQPEALIGLDVPEGPTVARARPLRHRANAVDRADLVAEHDRPIGADQRAVALFGVHQPGTWGHLAVLD